MRAFEQRTLTIPPGNWHAAAEAGWPDGLVLIASGELELVCAGGTRRRFAAGDLIWLRGLGLVALRNRGADDVVLLAVSRRR